MEMKQGAYLASLKMRVKQFLNQSEKAKPIVR